MVASSPIMMLGAANGTLTLGNLTATMTGTPNFATSVVLAEDLGNVTLTNVTFSGAATGKRFNCIMNGICETNTGAPDANLPGNVAGTTTAGGQAN